MIRDESECWSAVVSRDAAADGRFVYVVVTTGIHCRPSCPTPTPLRRNVRFFSDPAAANAAGFCACKRCRPMLALPLASHIAAVGKACAILGTSERAPALAALADAVGISRFHFCRVFKEVLATSPGEYFKTVRWQRLMDGLTSGRSVTAAIYDAGFGSVSRAYESARSMLGMTPAARRAGGAGTRVGFTIVEHGNGLLLVATTDEGVCAIEAASLMEQHGVRRLPVLDRKGRLTGLVSLSDIRGGASSKKPYAVTFYKGLPDGRGTLHDVPLGTVYVTGVDREADAMGAAEKVLRRAWSSHPWRGAADGCRVERGH